MTGFPRKVRDIIAARAGGACERCGLAAPAYQHHHRRPRGMGGSSADDTNRASNALCVCVPCHTDIESNREDALKYGWIVRQGCEPVNTSVLLSGRWVLLDDFGYVTPVEETA
jgi:5-methylcytosine-specific restriction enzyme A